MIVDTRDKPCPEPVLMTKNALESPIDSEITILVDNDISKENVIKFLTSNHLNYSVIERTDYFEIKTNVQADKSTDVKLKNIIDNKIKKDLVYYITSESAGTGDCELGQILMKNMLSTLDKLDSYPETMIFINTGVYLTTLNNDTVTSLKILEDKGVKILSCGTCLNFFKLNKDLKVGQVTDTYTVLNILNKAIQIIKL